MGFMAMIVGGASEALEEGSGDMVIWLGVSGITACVFAMVGSGMHFSGNRTTLAASLITIGAIWHIVSIGAFSIPGAVFLLLGALFAWLSRGRHTDATEQANADAPDALATA